MFISHGFKTVSKEKKIISFKSWLWYLEGNVISHKIDLEKHNVLGSFLLDLEVVSL